jgi:hypothetical protein
MITLPAAFLSMLIAIVVPLSSPVPEARTLPTIITVTSSPYCNSLADNFNGAMLQMLANERVLDQTDVQLESLNDVFSGSQTNYEQQFLHDRDALGRQETALNNSLPIMAHHIAQLRAGAHLTADPQAAAAVIKSADDLQTAYDHQKQLAIDLQNLYIRMLRFNIQRHEPAMGGFSWADMTAAPATRDVKAYLHFDDQRRVVAASEDQAVDVAYGAAQNYCTPKK